MIGRLLLPELNSKVGRILYIHKDLVTLFNTYLLKIIDEGFAVYLRSPIRVELGLDAQEKPYGEIFWAD